MDLDNGAIDYYARRNATAECDPAFIWSKAMGFRAGDDRIMNVPLDWIGFHYYTRRIVSDAGEVRNQPAARISAPRSNWILLVAETPTHAFTS